MSPGHETGNGALPKYHTGAISRPPWRAELRLAVTIVAIFRFFVSDTHAVGCFCP